MRSWKSGSRNSTLIASSRRTTNSSTNVSAPGPPSCWARQAISRGEILQEVWDLNPDTRTRVVDTFVLRLRKLIEPDPSVPRHLLSVRSFGYKLVAEPAEA